MKTFNISLNRPTQKIRPGTPLTWRCSKKNHVRKPLSIAQKIPRRCDFVNGFFFLGKTIVLTKRFCTLHSRLVFILSRLTWRFRKVTVFANYWVLGFCRLLKIIARHTRRVEWTTESSRTFNWIQNRTWTGKQLNIDCTGFHRVGGLIFFDRSLITAQTFGGRKRRATTVFTVCKTICTSCSRSPVFFTDRRQVAYLYAKKKKQ